MQREEAVDDNPYWLTDLYRRREVRPDLSGSDKQLVAGDRAESQTFTAYLSIYCCRNDPGGAYCGATASGHLVAPGMVACAEMYPFGTLFQLHGGSVPPTTFVCFDRGSAVVSPYQLDVWFYDCGNQQDPAPGTGWYWLQRTGTRAVVEVLE